MREKQRFDLPRVAELQPEEDAEERQKQEKPSPDTSLEAAQETSPKAKQEEARMKAQEMWDLFRDVATAWRKFIVDHKSEIKEQKRTSSEGRFDVKNLFFNLEHPLTQEFHKDPKYKRLQKQIGELYRDTAVKDAWQKGMTAHAIQWEGVNGTWTDYCALQDDERKLEDARNELLREKFEEQKLAPSKRRRTLATELTDGAIALEALRIRKQEIAAQDSDLATKILARELEERRRELQSKEGFMWFPSRQRIRELVAEKIANRTSLRIINLEGEAGTGKTTLARTISRLFTGHEPFKKTCGKRMKADRALFADKDLEAGSSPTFYEIVLKAVTGKERADGSVVHDGCGAFLDELNTMENDEARVLATNCDGMRVGQPTGYDSNGANPNDIVQPHALILAAQNLAGSKFSDRTVFTPEVKRKMDIIQVEYPPLTQDDPELFESFLVALMDGDGRITASKEEFAAPWKDVIVEKEGNKYSTEELVTNDDKVGGALWRFAKLLDASYKSFYGKANVLTDSNPDARLTGEPLTPGDVYAWLSEYRDARKRQQSLASFLSEKYFTWIDQKFRAESDIGNRELYLQLGEHFGILAKDASSGEHHALPKQRVAFDLLTHKDIAYLSPRVPRKKELIPPPDGGQVPQAEVSELKTMTVDLVDDNGRMYEAITVRIEDSNDPRAYFITPEPGSPDTDSMVRIIGMIRECNEHPEFVGGHLYENFKGSERKGITLLFPAHFELVPAEKHIIRVESRKKDIINPFGEVYKDNGSPNKEKLNQFEIDLGEILETCKETYRERGLTSWADAMPSTVADIFSGDPKQQKRFEAYLKEGRIPVFMPPAHVQLETMKSMISGDRFAHFKPDITTTDASGATSTVEADLGYITWNHFKTLMENKHPSLVTGVPDTCYIMWEKPTKKPDGRNKTLADQKKYIQDEQAKFKSEHNVTQPLIGGMMPAEYLALQIVFPDIVGAQAQKDNVNIQTLEPLDKSTYTRFPGVDEAGGYVADADWNAGDSLLRLNRGGEGADEDDGVRLPVREIKITP